MPPWTMSATAIVRDIFKTKRFLTAQEIWKRGTEGVRPQLPPAHAIDQYGRIRMKRVSNIREGRRPWVPPPTASLPDHPFQSKRFLKSTILAALESRGLIHLARVNVPITTKEGLLEAEKQSARRFRRMIHEAKKNGAPPPTMPPEPRTTEMQYLWTLGPESEPSSSTERSAAPPPPPLSPESLEAPLTPQEVEAKFDEEGWEQAEELENAFHAAKELEHEMIEQRRAARRQRYAQEREEARRQKEEDRELGRHGALLQERRRLQAIQSIEEYSRQTGEDVSTWFDEVQEANLGDERPETLPRMRPKQTNRDESGRIRLTPIPATKRRGKG